MADSLFVAKEFAVNQEDRVTTRFIARTSLRLLAALLLAMSPGAAFAQEVLGMINVGGGPQPNGDQVHRTAGVDLNLWRWDRTARQQISVGVGYTFLRSNRGPNKQLHAISVYPQLTLTPADPNRFGRFFPQGAVPYFFVRALGPSYISERTIGEREQGKRFTFQAQIGVGMRWKSDNRTKHLALSAKHFSNANLYADNDGIDMPLVLSYGVTF